MYWQKPQAEKARSTPKSQTQKPTYQLVKRLAQKYTFTPKNVKGKCKCQANSESYEYAIYPFTTIYMPRLSLGFIFTYLPEKNISV